MGAPSQLENIKERKYSELDLANGEVHQSRFNYLKIIDEKDRFLKKIKEMRKEGMTNTSIYFKLRERYQGNEKELWYRILYCLKN
ncbi:MAG TPA: hypothetical protein PLV21_08280 [Cyclobacteriaceae bacterium]|nr:hypothetical protein [Cyclobacteriaceae bacterium]HRJ81865.1 hypothetical protein [Cyclobacteriaceae bacterium]